MRCDFCGQQTEKNYFVDDFTILCKNCAEHSGIIGGKKAMGYIKKKATGAVAIVALLATLGAAQGAPGHGATPIPRPNYNHITETARHADKHAKRAETIAVVATFTAVLAVVLAVKASENNPGHIQIARF